MRSNAPSSVGHLQGVLLTEGESDPVRLVGTQSALKPLEQLLLLYADCLDIPLLLRPSDESQAAREGSGADIEPAMGTAMLIRTPPRVRGRW